MRDPNRITPIINALAEGWAKVPDWRFGQLIENLKRYIGAGDIFYLEDENMLKYIEDYFDIESRC